MNWYILSFETLEHVHDERQVINEINRVSKNNSHLVLAVPIEFGLVLLFKEFFRGLVAHKLYKGSWSQSVREARYSVKELFYAVCYRKTDKVVRIPHTHKGYDYRETLDLLNTHWRVIYKINTPFNFLPDQLSYGCIFVLKKVTGQHPPVISPLWIRSHTANFQKINPWDRQIHIYWETNRHPTFRTNFFMSSNFGNVLE